MIIVVDSALSCLDDEIWTEIVGIFKDMEEATKHCAGLGKPFPAPKFRRRFFQNGPDEIKLIRVEK